MSEIKLEFEDGKWKQENPGDRPPDLIDEQGRVVFYGVYDTKDSIWLGDDFGPRRFDNYTLARVAAQIVEIQVFENDYACRYQARIIPDADYTKKDEVKTKMRTLEALTRKENGEFD